MQDVSEDVAEQYQSLLLTLRVLAKFLGFIEALPYSCQDTLSEELAEVIVCLLVYHILVFS